MADLSDVLTAVKNLALNVLYQPTVTIGGAATAADTITLTATPQRGSAVTARYTVKISDTPNSIAAGLATAWYNATGLLSELPHSVSGAVLTLGLYPGPWRPPPGLWTLNATVSGAATETAVISGEPGATQASPAAGAAVACGMGWPDGDTLDRIAASIKTTPTAMVTVFAPDGYYRNITRYNEDWQTLVEPAPTLTASLSGKTVTIGGTVSVPQVVALLIDTGPGALPFLYQVQPGDNLNSIAANLAALVNASTPASATGPAISIPGASAISPRIGASGIVYRELNRQIRRIFVDVWTPDPALRTAIGQALTPAFARAKFVLLPDLTAARVIECGGHESDNTEKTGIYRRSLVYDIEYPTIETRTANQIVFFEAQMQNGQAPSLAPIVNQYA